MTGALDSIAECLIALLPLAIFIGFLVLIMIIIAYVVERMNSDD